MADVLTEAATEHSLLLKLATALLPLSVGVLLLGGAAVYTVLQPVRAYFVPTGFTGMLRAGELTEEYLGERASQMAELRYIFNWKNLTRKQTQFQALLVPPRAKTFKEKTAPEELKLAKQFQVRSDFVVTNVEVLARQGAHYRVLVHGLRSLWINGVADDDEMTITFILTPFTKGGNPQGLQITDYQGTPPLKVAGR